MRLALPALLALLLCTCIGGAHALWGLSQPSCPTLLEQFKRDLGRHVAPTNTSDPFVVFLHVPRTAGKTYAHCFLRAAIPPSKRCSPSYDFLRLNVSQEGCRLLVSHDDYSLTKASWLIGAGNRISTGACSNSPESLPPSPTPLNLCAPLAARRPSAHGPLSHTTPRSLPPYQTDRRTSPRTLWW